MAEACSVKPWDEKHEDGQKMAKVDKALLTMLIKSIEVLTSEMVLSDGFWNMLLQKGVVDEKLMADLQALDPKEIQVCSLVQHLMRGKVHQVHGFFWALVNTKQHKLAERLGFPAKNYVDMPLMLKSSFIKCPSCSDVYSSNAYIMVECGHYICRPCIKGAKFALEADKTEGIQCPVPECGEVTMTLPNMHDDIGLEKDEVFMDIIGDLMKDCSKDETCHLCSYKLNYSYQKHFCSGCKKLLCGACIKDHKAKHHQIVHKHTADVCCLHGKKTETFCFKCNIFRCDAKDEKPCDHKAAGKEAKKMNTSLQNVEKLTQEISNQTAELEQVDVVLNNRRDEMVEFVHRQRDHVKKEMDKWSDDNLSHISKMTRLVKVKHKMSLQWKAISPDLIDIQTHQPWLDLPLDNFDLTLPPEAESFISLVRDGEPPSNILSGVPYVLTPAPVPAPQRVNCIAEWKIPSVGYRPTVAWTPDVRLLVTTGTGLHQVNYNGTSSPCTASLIHAVTNPTHISTAEDGSWVMSVYDTGKLVINDVNKGGVREWTPPGLRAYSAAIDNSGIYIRSHDSPTIFMYSRDLVEQRQYQIDPKWNNKLSFIYLNQSGEMLLGLREINVVLVINSKTGESRSIQNKGTKGKLNYPVGVCTVGGCEYILVSESKSHCIGVFSYQGEYLHDMCLGGIEEPSSVSVLERQGEPTLMALTTNRSGQWYVKFYTLS